MPETWNVLGFPLLSERPMLSAERDVRGLTWLMRHRIPREIVSNLLMLKCSPWLAEKEQTAFKEDADGWMSGNESMVPLLISSR